ncbi:MAG: hypothetical protein KGH94_03165 [Candidatus Micrarchaeota archaeon]|nr:hypothetical protein [Candidatus Micrarchaeota archaeon]
MQKGRMKKILIAAAIAAAPLSASAQQLDQHTLAVLKAEFPNGVPNYLNWNDPNRKEMMRRAAHLAEDPAILKDGETILRSEERQKDEKILAFGAGLALTGAGAGRRYYKARRTWLARKREADEADRDVQGHSGDIFNPVNLLRKGTIESRALEETSNSVSSWTITVGTLWILRGAASNLDAFTSTSTIEGYKFGPEGRRRMLLTPIETEGQDGTRTTSWIWDEERLC